MRYCNHFFAPIYFTVQLKHIHLALSGVAGDWKNHFSPEQDFKFTAVLKEEMNGTNIKFPWDEE
jgi:hypothetical protein